MTASASTSRIDELIAWRGGASLAEAGIDADQALAIARERPDIEPVFLARFRSRQGKSHVEEVRAYAWPSQKIAMRHFFPYQPSVHEFARLVLWQDDPLWRRECSARRGTRRVRSG
jgi:hypothetical protein